ncbi:MAG TPA: sensor histidine kinase [Thermoleophilia bacterium]|nr:sensor histidine kinase [Thermoleophilia bacterium]
MAAVAVEKPLATQRWVFAMTVAFLYAAVVLRSLLAFEGSERYLALILMAAWLLLLLSEPTLSRVWPPYFALYVGLQAAFIAVLLPTSDSSDFFAILLAIPSMQAMQRWRPRTVAVVIALFAALTGLCLVDEYGPAQAVTFAAIYAAADIFLATFALATRRALEARLRNEALVGELRQANLQMTEYAQRLERLAGAHERQRLARELHDSVTQTLFSMTLTAKSAVLLLGRDPRGLQDQLDQIEHLARDALAEMSVLGDEQAASLLTEGGLVATLQRHLAERAHQDGLSVSLEREGDERLPDREEQALLRIAQEALNNVVKHAGVSTAVIRVRLRQPFRLEIGDRGRGFDPARAGERGVGLTSMRERADEIGWRFAVVSSPGAGTRVVVEEMSSEGGESGAGD